MCLCVLEYDLTVCKKYIFNQSVPNNRGATVAVRQKIGNNEITINVHGWLRLFYPAYSQYTDCAGALIRIIKPSSQITVCKRTKQYVGAFFHR